MVNLKEVWNMYTPIEKRNIGIYIIGIMFYKFGLEAFNGSVVTMATDRFNLLDSTTTFRKVGILTGLNQAMQCVGSILIAPLIKKFPTRSVLSGAIVLFGLLAAILLIVDGSTGGRIKTPSDSKAVYGRFNPDGIFPVYCITGIAYGMVELIRRVIPRDIVGGHVGKLKRMDAIVHVMYEVAGTIGAFASAAMIKALGNNYAFIITPPFFAVAGVVWMFISTLDFKAEEKGKDLADELGTDLADVDRRTGLTGYLAATGHGFVHFGQAVYVGASITLTNRKFIWLVPGYAFALYGHRYLENGLANIFAKKVLNDSSYQQIIVGGSNFGELLGALTVFFTANAISTPIPFIRLDALLLLIVWVLPYYYPPANDYTVAWKMAGMFIPISFGWAAGDVSLAAYIQSSLARVEAKTENVSALGSVMAFLYVTYIVINAVLSSVLGTYVDGVIAASPTGDSHSAFIYIAGVQFTILSFIILCSTLIPRGALALNPKLLDNEVLDQDLEVSVPNLKKDQIQGEGLNEKDGRSSDGEVEKTST